MSILAGVHSLAGQIHHALYRVRQPSRLEDKNKDEGVPGRVQRGRAPDPRDQPRARGVR